MSSTSESRRVVLLGASNLARGLGIALRAAIGAGEATAKTGAATHLFVAGGRGRAYSRGSTFLLRSLPAIADCRLWPALELELAGDPAGRLFAAVTDLGNDLAYGAGVEETFSAVRAILERLLERDARITVAAPPLASLERYPIAWLDAVRRFFFPASPLPATEILRRVHSLDCRLRRHCGTLQVPLIEPSPEWFGFDPIHHRARHHGEVWRAMVAPWSGDEPPRAGVGMVLRRRLLSAWPEQSSLVGREIVRHQPCVVLDDGTKVSLF